MKSSYLVIILLSNLTIRIIITITTIYGAFTVNMQFAYPLHLLCHLFLITIFKVGGVILPILQVMELNLGW